MDFEEKPIVENVVESVEIENVNAESAAEVPLSVDVKEAVETVAGNTSDNGILAPAPDGVEIKPGNSDYDELRGTIATLTERLKGLEETTTALRTENENLVNSFQTEFEKRFKGTSGERTIKPGSDDITFETIFEMED